MVIKVKAYCVKAHTRKSPTKKTKKPAKNTYKSIGHAPTVPIIDVTASNKKFPSSIKRNGIVFKLATLSKGMSYFKADSTLQINKKEGNDVVMGRIKTPDNKYIFATYVHKRK